MHSRSHSFFVARNCCWSLSVEYSKSATPKHSSTAVVARRNFKVEFKANATPIPQHASHYRHCPNGLALLALGPFRHRILAGLGF